MNLLIPSRLSRRRALAHLAMASGAATIPGQQALKAEANTAATLTFSPFPNCPLEMRA
jgi:ribosomal 50S subunit-recycling heat shock protein